MVAPSRPAFGRTKHELPLEDALLDAFPNDRYHYNFLGFLQKRRGGGGGSRSSGGSSSGSSSSSRGSSGSSSSGSSSSGSKPSVPKSGSTIGGSAPGKPKSPSLAPPKAPKLPKIPKPKPGWKPPKGSLPGNPPGHSPYHGAGGHLPVIGGGNSHDHDRASSADSCINPKGMDRLRCEKADAVVGTILAVIALFLVPFLIYLCIMYCKRRRSERKTRHEEDGMELTRRGMDCDPGPQTNREYSDGASNIGLAISTSQETSTLTKEQTEDRSFGSSQGRKPPPAYQPRTRSSSRGRKLFRHQHSIRSVTSSLSSGMIRTAIIGQALQDPTLIDVPPSLAGSKKDSERRCSSSDADRSSDYKSLSDGERRCLEDQWRDCVDKNVEDGDTREEAERRSRSSSRRSSSHVSEQRNEKECCPDDAGSRCSSRRSRSRGSGDRPDNEADALDDTASRHSVSRPASPASCHQEEDGYAEASSETHPVD